MGECIELRGGGGTLLLEASVNDLGWTPCTLISGTRVYLGADTLPYVVAGLLKAVGDLETAPDGSGQINGTPVRHALHLEEAHHSLYYGDESGERLLFWQSALRTPTIVGAMRLSPDQCRQWSETLRALLSVRQPIGATA